MSSLHTILTFVRINVRFFSIKPYSFSSTKTGSSYQFYETLLCEKREEGSESKSLCVLATRTAELS